MAVEELKFFETTASSLNNPEIQAWKQAGKRVVGTVCSNIPDEVLYGAGLLPLRLRAPGLQDTPGADSHLHKISCSYSRSVLELLLRGDLGFLDGLVTTNTCDHLLRLSGELQDKAGVPFLHYFSMYHTLGEASGEWFLREMEKLTGHLEESFATKISDDGLRHSISVYNRSRRLMARLNELRKNDPPPLSGAEYLQIVLTGMSIPREQFNAKLEVLIPALEERRVGSAGQPRLMIIGGSCDAPDFIGFIESQGATVVADQLCFGMRHYLGLIEEDAEAPLQAIAARYTSRVVCPAIMNGFDHSYGILREIVDRWHIDGIVCARLKFCDHWAGFRKLLAEELRAHGPALLDLEREYGTTGSGQISTRVQAFLEMLKS